MTKRRERRPIVPGLDFIQLRLDEHVMQGFVQIVIRVRADDRIDINRAARFLGLTQAQFCRNVLVQSARAVIAEAKSMEAA